MVRASSRVAGCQGAAVLEPGCSAAASEVSGRSFMQVLEGAFCRAPMSPCWWTGLPLGWSFRLRGESVLVVVARL